MASCYTRPIYDGDPITFDQFIWLIAMGMDKFQFKASVTDSHDYKYHLKHLGEAQKELQELDKMTPAEAQRKADESYDKQMKHYNEYLPAALARAARFREFYAQAEKWIPPTEKHAWIKKSMLEQLKYDLRTDDEVRKSNQFPVRQTAGEWIADHREWIISSISRHSSCLEESVKVVKDRNEWVETLDNFVQCPEERLLP